MSAQLLADIRGPRAWVVVLGISSVQAQRLHLWIKWQMAWQLTPDLLGVFRILCIACCC